MSQPDREPLDPRVLVQFLSGISQHANLITVADCDAFLQQVNRLHAVLAITDPTAYRDLIHADQTDQWPRLVRAFRAFRAELDAIHAEVQDAA
jgi:hypothetical protein